MCYNIDTVKTNFVKSIQSGLKHSEWIKKFYQPSIWELRYFLFRAIGLEQKVGIGNFGFRSFNAVVSVGPSSKFEGRDSKCSSRNRVLLAPVPGPVPCSSEFDAIGIAISPVLPPIGNHRNRSSEFVESQQKSPYANGGMSLGGNRIIADNRYLWAMGVRIPTAILVKAGRF